jgi:hypothetical protein
MIAVKATLTVMQSFCHENDESGIAGESDQFLSGPCLGWAPQI